MVQDMWKEAQQGAWKQCLWLEKTLAALHPWVQPCLWLAGIPPVLCWAPQMQRKPKPCLEIITTRLYFHFREENNADHMLFPVCQALPQVSWWHFLCWLLSTLSSRKFRAGAERNHRHSSPKWWAQCQPQSRNPWEGGEWGCSQAAGRSPPGPAHPRWRQGRDCAGAAPKL